MIYRIISSGNPGVELAALDVARKLGINHGGWLTKGTSRQNRELMATYHLKETESFGQQYAVEKNVKDANGILLVSRGEKIPRLKYPVEAALKHHRQFLGIDLKQYPAFEAASLINSWAQIQKVTSVFVTGATELEVPGIYRSTHKILETVFYLGYVKSDAYTLSPAPGNLVTDDSAKSSPPRTVEECVERLNTIVSLKERALIANIQADELGQLRGGLGEFIKNAFGLYSGNDALMQSCAQVGKLSRPLAEEACAVILRAFWEDLRRTHRLRVVR